MVPVQACNFFFPFHSGICRSHMCNAADEPAVLDENLVKLLDALAAALAPAVSQAAGPAQIPPADGGFCPAQKVSPTRALFPWLFFPFPLIFQFSSLYRSHILRGIESPPPQPRSKQPPKCF